MYNFFVGEECRRENGYAIVGADYNHIANVLRMQVGDRLLVSIGGTSSLCEIVNFEKDLVNVKIVCENYNDTELPVKIVLFQALPKADKLEFIIQKAVELGVCEIVPVESARSVVKIEDKKKEPKRQRWQAISESSAKQCKRNVIPVVKEPISFNKAVEMMAELDIVLIPYENKNGMADTVSALDCIDKNFTIGVYVGAEGGIDDKEIASLAELKNSRIVSLGKRILRAETAAVTALSMVMLYVEAKNFK